MSSSNNYYEKKELTIFIRSGSAETGPPLGTILGNLGVNIIKFCKEFNEFTKELPTYFLLKVKIMIEENKNFTFTVDLPSIGFLLFLLKKEEKNGDEVIFYYIFFEDLIRLAKFKLPYYKLERAIKIIKGSLYSSSIQIKI
jgi:large subunit ribosomal protein L11